MSKLAVIQNTVSRESPDNCRAAGSSFHLLPVLQLNHRATNSNPAESRWEHVWVSVYEDTSARSVREWARVCPSAGRSGVGGPGSANRATAATTTQTRSSGCADSKCYRLAQELQLWGRGGGEGWREMAGEVLATETTWWEQACPRLRISGGSRGSIPSLPCHIVLLRNSPQHHHLVEIRRETLSKTARGFWKDVASPDWETLWYLDWGSVWKAGASGLGAAAWGPQITF